MASQLDFSHPYWQHLQIRQAQMIRYLGNYLNLSQSVVIYSPLCDLMEIENKHWIYAHSDEEISSQEWAKFPSATTDKVIHLKLTDLPFSPDSVSNIIIGIGTPLEQTSAIIKECYTALKPEGFLILFYPNKSHFIWWLSTTIRALHNKIKAPSTIKLVTIAHQWQFQVIENFTFSLIPPIVLEYIPLAQGKWDNWCSKIPLPIGQCNALVLQKKTIHLISTKHDKKAAYQTLKPCFQTRHVDYQCQKK